MTIETYWTGVVDGEERRLVHNHMGWQDRPGHVIPGEDVRITGGPYEPKDWPNPQKDKRHD